jgi:hypothetical protein
MLATGCESPNLFARAVALSPSPKTAAVEKGPLTAKSQDIACPSSCLCHKKSVLLIVLDIISDNYSMSDIKHIRI